MKGRYALGAAVLLCGLNRKGGCWAINEKGAPGYAGTPEKSYLHLNSVGSSIRDAT